MSLYPTTHPQPATSTVQDGRSSQPTSHLSLRSRIRLCVEEGLTDVHTIGRIVGIEPVMAGWHIYRLRQDGLL